MAWGKDRFKKTKHELGDHGLVGKADQIITRNMIKMMEEYEDYNSEAGAEFLFSLYHLL